MLNPLRSEAEAYRFLLVTVAAFAAIVAAKVLLGTWAALAVFLLALALAGGYYVRARAAEQRERMQPVRRGGDDERRILVIANETVAGERLAECIHAKSEGVREEVLVVAPALNSHLRHWTSDEDPARAQAQRRLERSVERLAALGISARGQIGDSDPLQAMEDALRTFGPDEIIISTHPEGRSHWLERGIVRHARERFDVDVTHVVVDLEAEREEVR